MHATFRKYLVEILILEVFALYIKTHEVYKIFLVFWSLNLEA